MKNKLTSFFEQEFFNYCAGSSSLDWATPQVVEIINLASILWLKVDSDADGLTTEQEKVLDGIVAQCVQDLMDLDQISVHNYRFEFRNKTDDYKEYDGMLINAPSEDLAWEIFLGTDCDFGLPNERDYSCIKES